MMVEVSNGELVDKVSILAIKLQRMSSAAKRVNVKQEHDLLSASMAHIGISVEQAEYQELLTINGELWDIEDAIRRKEVAQAFDAEFIRLARSVYIVNDQRAAVKKRINEKSGSALHEEKEYVEYKVS